MALSKSANKPMDKGIQASIPPSKPTFTTGQLWEYARTGSIISPSSTETGAVSHHTIWRIPDRLYLGWDEITARTRALSYRAWLRVVYGFTNGVLSGFTRLSKNIGVVTTRATDILVGYWNTSPVKVQDSVISELWHGIQKRQEQGQHVEPEWNTALWSAQDMPLSQHVLRFMQLYRGSSDLYRAAVDAMRAEIISDSPESISENTNDTSSSAYAAKITDILRKTSRYTETELYEVNNFVIVSYLLTTKIAPNVDLAVAKLYPIDPAMPAAQRAELLTKQRYATANLRLMALRHELSHAKYAANSGMQRVRMLIEGTLAAESKVVVDELYVGEMRVFDDHYRFVWGNNNLSDDGQGVITAATEGVDVIRTGSKLVYERNYIPVTIKMTLGWRILSAPVRAMCVFQDLVGSLYTQAWNTEWSLRRLSPAKDYEGVRKFYYVEGDNRVERERFTTIIADYEAYLAKLEVERQELVAKGQDYIANRMLITSLSWLVSASKAVYATTVYFLLQPIFIIVHMVVLVYMLFLVALFVPAVATGVAVFSLLVYDLDGSQGFLPPIRIVVFDLILNTLWLVIVNGLRAIWYMFTGIVFAIIAGAGDVLQRLYNMFIVSSLGLRAEQFRVVASAIRNSERVRSRGATIWYQPPESWLYKRLCLAASRQLYLTQSTLSDNPNVLGKFQVAVMELLIDTGFSVGLTWEDITEYDRATVNTREVQLIAEFGKQESLLQSQLPQIKPSQIKLSPDAWRGSIGCITRLVNKYTSITDNDPGLERIIYKSFQEIGNEMVRENINDPYYEYTDSSAPDFTMPPANDSTVKAYQEYLDGVCTGKMLVPAQIWG